MDTESLVVDAFAQLGIDVLVPDDLEAPGVDLVFIDPAGTRIAVELHQRALVTEDVVRKLVSDGDSDSDGDGEARPAALLVADRVTDTARKELLARRGGYLDLRGRLALHTDRMVIDAEVAPARDRPERTDALSGRAGLEVAAALLMRPEGSVGVRAMARELDRSASTVSEVLAALRRAGLIDRANAVAGTELFWRVADRWPMRRTNLSSAPPADDLTVSQSLRVEVDDVKHQAGWALTDTAAAVVYGAPLAFRADQAVDFFVPDVSVVRRATTLLGAASSTAQVRATVRAAPIRAVVQSRVTDDANPFPWPLAHPLFVALDLANDAGRGREILDSWTPDERWSRVW